jgi:TonB family protein
MRIISLAIATLFWTGCSSSPSVKEQPPRTYDAFAIAENPDVVYDRTSVPEVEMDDAAEDAPKLISKVDPTFPEKALRAGKQGNVLLRVLIAPSGQVKGATILESDDGIFNQPSISAALKWTFEPPKVDGKPAAVWVRIPFRFAISKK